MTDCHPPQNLLCYFLSISRSLPAELHSNSGLVKPLASRLANLVSSRQIGENRLQSCDQFCRKPPEREALVFDIDKDRVSIPEVTAQNGFGDLSF